MQGKVLSVRIKEASGSPTQHREQLELVDGRGIVGDMYFDDHTREKRQVLLLDVSTLNEFGYEPGMLREQILVDMVGLQELEPGRRLRLGDSEVEITYDCTPCLTMAGYVNETGQDFVRKMMGRRGMLARVVKSGSVREGDVIESVG